MIIKIVKAHIGFRNLLTEIQLYTLILLECISLEVLNKIREDKSIIHSIFRIQDNESIMCGIYCIAFIEHMPAGKFLLDCTNLLSPNDYKKNDSVICKYFTDEYVKF